MIIVRRDSIQYCTRNCMSVIVPVKQRVSKKELDYLCWLVMRYFDARDFGYNEDVHYQPNLKRINRTSFKTYLIRLRLLLETNMPADCMYKSFLISFSFSKYQHISFINQISVL